MRTRRSAQVLTFNLINAVFLLAVYVLALHLTSRGLSPWCGVWFACIFCGRLDFFFSSDPRLPKLYAPRHGLTLMWCLLLACYLAVAAAILRGGDTTMAVVALTCTLLLFIVNSALNLMSIKALRKLAEEIAATKLNDPALRGDADGSLSGFRTVVLLAAVLLPFSIARKFNPPVPPATIDGNLTTVDKLFMGNLGKGLLIAMIVVGAFVVLSVIISLINKRVTAAKALREWKSAQKEDGTHAE
ncbi:MAG: hypothetical protein LBN02_09170 [Oscillospiraceae bacterium]|jgi:hypothetical protein|nr:hypothetical protein [Oscillospiraceae bacterium]